MLKDYSLWNFNVFSETRSFILKQLYCYYCYVVLMYIRSFFTFRKKKIKSEPSYLTKISTSLCRRGVVNELYISILNGCLHFGEPRTKSFSMIRVSQMSYEKLGLGQWKERGVWWYSPNIFWNFYGHSRKSFKKYKKKSLSKTQNPDVPTETRDNHDSKDSRGRGRTRSDGSRDDPYRTVQFLILI